MGEGPLGGIRVPLSLVQQFMWVLEAWAPAPGFYNEVFRQPFPFSADPVLLAQAMTVLARRHEALRTAFPSASGGPYQSIRPPFEVQVPVTDLRQVPPDERPAELRRLQAVETDAPFDVAAGQVFRARLFRLDEDRSELCVVMDHLVADATSEAILASELDEVYAALAAGREPVLAARDIDYADYAVWQRRWMDDDRLQAHLDYWKAVFRGIPSGRKVPYSAEVRETAASVRSDLTEPPAMHVFTIPVGLSAALRKVPRASGFVVCSAAVAALVARATDEPDTLLVTSVSGRDRLELEGVVGLFGGTSVLRIDLSGDPVLEVVLRRARAGVLGMLEHQQLPFSHVIDGLEEAGIDLALEAIPVAVHFFRAAHRRWAPGTSMVARPPDHEGPLEIGLREVSKPLEFRFYDDGDTLWCELLYHPDYYSAETVARVVSDLQTVLQALAENPLLHLSEVPVTARG